MLSPSAEVKSPTMSFPRPIPVLRWISTAGAPTCTFKNGLLGSSVGVRTPIINLELYTGVSSHFVWCVLYELWCIIIVNPSFKIPREFELCHVEPSGEVNSPTMSFPNPNPVLRWISIAGAPTWTLTNGFVGSSVRFTSQCITQCTWTEHTVFDEIAVGPFLTFVAMTRQFLF